MPMCCRVSRVHRSDRSWPTSGMARHAPLPSSPRLLRRAGAEDSDIAVHGQLIRLGSGYLDHGQAHVPGPGRERGFLSAVSALYAADEFLERPPGGGESRSGDRDGPVTCCGRSSRHDDGDGVRDSHFGG